MEQEIEKKITKDAISLEDFGMNELAWRKEEAEKLITSLMNDDIGILGGDIYKLYSGRVEPLYDNWSCDPLKNESREEYFLRSKSQALNYISKYPVSHDSNIIFAIIFTDTLNE